MIRMDHRSSKPFFLQLPLLGQLKNRRKTKFVFFGAKGTQLVGEHFWKHWHGAINQINRGSTIYGFFVQLGTFLQVMRHVRNVHTYFPMTVFQLLNGKGIVKIFGIMWIDGKSRSGSHISTLRHFLFGDLGWNLIRQRLNVFWEFIGQTIFHHNRMHFYIVISRFSEYFTHASYRTVLWIVPRDHFNNHLIPILRTVQLFHGNEKINVNLLV